MHVCRISISISRAQSILFTEIYGYSVSYLSTSIECILARAVRDQDGLYNIDYDHEYEKWR